MAMSIQQQSHYVKGMRYNSIEAAVPFIEIPVGLEGIMTRDDMLQLLPEVINRQIQSRAEPRRIGRSLVDSIRINNDTETFLKEYGFSAAEISEGGEIPAAKPRWEKTTLYTLMAGVALHFTNTMIEDQRWDLVRRATNLATDAMTRYEDNHIISTLYAGVPDGTNIKGDYQEDHQVEAAATDPLNWSEFVEAYEILLYEGYKPKFMVMHPYQHSQMLKNQEFRDLTNNRYLVYPDRAERRVSQGDVGTILGMEIVVSHYAAKGKILMLDPDNYAVFAERRPLRIQNDEDILHQQQTVVMTQRYGTAILNHSGASMITGLKDDGF
jgi:HK97 family phage major capsid protein